MVNMGVRQQYGLHIPRMHRQLTIAAESLLTPALEQAAVKQIRFTLKIELMHGPGDGPGGSPKREFHRHGFFPPEH
jgi:hypothetical protein